ncbi:MAG: carbohydrate ABC transporter, N-acetylglucosamine/diacetylchitobiose-binding protein [Hamadaea sp.]|nr:carbohydrate ABC transporter, N-acetylglucosamine/diacetylchitobiose-binding protein [Hamadaea sp.]NUR51739.1 carbohydrate ABC transporter, N-acetylglucosamine/diacetylchitobiose-binding protein [Hamadaea sp.]
MSNSPSELNRRTVLRRAAVAGALAVPAVSFLAACTDDDKGGDTGGAAKSPTNPFGMKEDATVEVVIFDGGYGQKYATDGLEPNFKAAWPKATVKHTATQDITALLQPRFQGGNPPEFVNNSGTKSMDFGALVADEQLADLTELWDAPSVDDQAKKVRETVFAGTVEAGSFNGKPFVLYYVSTVFGIWYSGKLFKDNGWEAPKDWAGFLALCEKIKAKGITPYGYAGANAAYYQWNVILTQAAKIGGADILKNIDNLEDGAWTNDAVVKAASAWGTLASKGYISAAFEGLKHTEVQLQQNQYKLAMYPSGDWLEGEQAATTPKDFEYQLTPVPAYDGSDKLSPAAVRSAAGEGYFVSKSSANKAAGLEFMRQMLSKKSARAFTEITEAHAPTVVAGASDGFAFPAGVKSSQAALAAAGKDVVTLFFDGWYQDLDKEARAATNELMFGRIDGKAWGERIQKKADAIKKDASITKFKR